MFNMINLDVLVETIEDIWIKIAGARRVECWAQEAMWHYMSGSTFGACWDYFVFPVLVLLVF